MKLIIDKYLLYSIIKLLNYFILWGLNKFYFIFNLLLVLKFKHKIYKIRLKEIKTIYRIKLRKCLGSIKFKLFEVYLENIIVKFYSIFFFITISNIYINKGLFLKYKVNKTYKYKNWLLFQTILISILYNNTKIISEYLSSLIAVEQKHRQVLRGFILLMEQFFFSNIIKLIGFQLRLNGKLSGNMRKSKYHYKIGKIKKQTISDKLNYSLIISYTKFGSISVKSLLVNGNN